MGYCCAVGTNLGALIYAYSYILVKHPGHQLYLGSFRLKSVAPEIGLEPMTP